MPLLICGTVCRPVSRLGGAHHIGQKLARCLESGHHLPLSLALAFRISGQKLANGGKIILMGQHTLNEIAIFRERPQPGRAHHL